MGATTSAGAIDASTAVGAVSLTVRDLARSRSFYERALGLTGRELVDGGLAFGASGGPDLVALHEDAFAPPLDRGATGLFHVAILLPTRRDLARALARVAGARWPLDGASDHLVSEALYLSDPDGHGIELYRDRPRGEWSRDEHGTIRMATLPLDLRGLAGELDGAPGPEPSAPFATRVGHVHLQVSELERTEAFYHGVLGFDVTVRSYPGALFVSAGGYHHHIGLNTWHSAGGAPPAPGAIGLRSFEVRLAGPDARERVVERVRAAGLKLAPAPGDPDGARAASVVRDPSGNAVILRCD